MRTRKTVVILISGKAGAGKTTLSDKLVEKLRDIPSMDVMQYSFASPIKYIAKAFFGWDGQKDEKGRKLLQHIGAVGREYDENIWVKHFINQLDKQAGMFPRNFAVIDDWRFPNELTYLQKNPILDVVTIRAFGRGGLNGELSSDASENSLPEIVTEELEPVGSGGLGTHGLYSYYDFALENDKDLELLDLKLDKILAQITKQYIVE